jgi:hypothetical protein
LEDIPIPATVTPLLNKKSIEFVFFFPSLLLLCLYKEKKRDLSVILCSSNSIQFDPEKGKKERKKKEWIGMMLVPSWIFGSPVGSVCVCENYSPSTDGQ